MLCNSDMKHDVRISAVFYSILLFFYVSVQICVTLPVSSEDYSTTATTLMQNSTDDNLYVIKAVVYEIGILTDANNTSDEVTERQDVKISFYNPPNKSPGP